MKTVEQARAMICHVSMNMTPHRQFCVAKSCMAWRWHNGEPADGETTALGYCGLAGVPYAQTP